MTKQYNLYDYTHSFLKFLLSLFFYCLLSVAATCAAAESGYWMNETEHNQLLTNLNRLAVLNQNSQATSEQLEQQLQTSQAALTKADAKYNLASKALMQASVNLTAAERKSMEQQKQINLLEASSKNQETLLASANKYLETYNQQTKAKILRLKTERNILIIGITLYATYKFTHK